MTDEIVDTRSANPYKLIELKSTLALQLDRLSVLQKNKLVASANALESRIKETKRAIAKMEKATKQ